MWINIILLISFVVSSVLYFSACRRIEKAPDAVVVAGQHNIYIEHGADFLMELTLNDENGDPIDLTTSTFSGQVRKTATSADSLGDFTFTILNQAVPANVGKVQVKMSNAVTSAIPVNRNTTYAKTPTKYAYDIERSESGGLKERWLEGVATVSPEVTR